MQGSHQVLPGPWLRVGQVLASSLGEVAVLHCCNAGCAGLELLPQAQVTPGSKGPKLGFTELEVDGGGSPSARSATTAGALGRVLPRPGGSLLAASCEVDFGTMNTPGSTMPGPRCYHLI